MQFSGLIVLETDDFFGGGIGDQCHHAINELRKRYNLGKWVDLMDESHEYGGRTIKQLANYAFVISMQRYLQERAREIDLPRGRGKTPLAEANAVEITAFRGLNGKLAWAAREGMPNGSGDASLLASTLPHPRVKDLQEANASLRRLLQHNATITIQPIPLDKLRLVQFSDSSLGNTSGGTSQTAWMVCACDGDLFNGEEATISPLTYRSHQMDRAGSATLLVEANSMSE